jgi:hypothetical protein
MEGLSMSILPTLRGIIHGKTIELDEMPGLPEGQQVAVTVQAVSSGEKNRQDALAALKGAAGAWSDDPKGLEQFLQWNREQRKHGRG